MQLDPPPEAPSAARRWVLSLVAILMISLVAFLFWASERARERDRREARLLMELRSDASQSDIAQCLEGIGKNGLALHRIRDGRAAYRGNNAATKISVEIRDEGIGRIVRIYTPLARPLRESQAAAVRYCLAPRTR